jgi:coenzyme F420-0:L-glutamate ligase/coenzyme F420-1:gamma-L-glutamate ligase
MDPLLDYVGDFDAYGNMLHTTQIAVADELAAAAELVTGKALGIPVTIIRGYAFETMEDVNIQRLLRTGERDLFR